MDLGRTPDIELTDAEYRMVCELLKSRCGLHFDEDSRYLVEKRLSRRARESDVGSFASYHLLLRDGSRGEEELAFLIDSLTTNETYFFRELGQLHALIEEIVPELLLRRRALGASGPVTIWSAGCASGEEPFSIVMLAKEAGLDVSRDLRIYAADISRAALARSRRGLYREASFRETEPAIKQKYFSEKDGHYRITDEVRKCVDFIHLNLMDRDRIALLGTVDVVLCRNVIIYFDQPTKKAVIETFYDKLRPGGYLLLGHSESLINISSAFELKHLRNDLVYRRPAPGEATRDPWHDLASATLDETDDPRGVV